MRLFIGFELSYWLFGFNYEQGEGSTDGGPLRRCRWFRVGLGPFLIELEIPEQEEG